MNSQFLSSLGIALLIAGAAGCATKRYVRDTVDPVNNQVVELDKRSAENARAIEQLDEKTQREISKAGEKAEAADAHAAKAAQAASEALAKGGQAIEKADGARTLAESSIARAGQLERVVENLDNFRVTSTKTVYFGFNKASLPEDAAKELDDVAQALANKTRYVIEVQGYTDSTGSAEYNYALSQRRAESVVRYLTTQHNIPVYRVHTLGHGKDAPVDAASRAEARKLSRRVEVKVYLPLDLPQSAERRP